MGPYFDPFWEGLSGNRMGSGPRRGPKIGVKIAPGWPKIPHFWAPPGTPFGRVWPQNYKKLRMVWPGPVQNPSRKGPQNGGQNGPKYPILTHFWALFWTPFGQYLYRPDGRTGGFRPGPVQNPSRKGSQKGPILTHPGQKGVKIGPHFGTPFWRVSPSILTILGPKMGPKRAQKGPKMGQNTPFWTPILDPFWTGSE